MKKTIVFALVFIGLIAVYMITRTTKRESINTDIAEATTPLFNNLDTGSVRTISITGRKKNTAVTLEKKDDIWTVREKGNAPADETKVEKVLTALKKMRRGETAGTHDPDGEKKYGLDTGVSVTVKDTTFILGKTKKGRTPLVMNDTLYFSPFDQPRVFTPYDGEWRKKQLISTDRQQNMLSITITKGDVTATLSMSDDGKTTVSGIEKPDVKQADKLWKQIGRLHISNFLDTEKETVDYTMKDKKKTAIPKAIVTVSYSDGSDDTISFTGRKVKDGNAFLISVNDSNPVGISKYYYNAVVNTNLTKD